MMQILKYLAQLLCWSAPGAAIAIPFSMALPEIESFFAMILPDLEWINGIEKLGVIGIMALMMMLFIWERRHFILKVNKELESIGKMNEKVVHIQNEHLELLKEIKTGQSENLSRMWDMVSQSRPC